MIVGFDTETRLIRPGQLAPPMVCLTLSVGKDSWLYHAHDLGPPVSRQSSKPPAQTAREAFLWLLDQTACGLNTAYDLAVCLREWPDLYPLVFRKLDEGTILDVGLNQQLIDNAHGQLKYFTNTRGYSLNALEHRLLGRDRKTQKYGPESWRLRYRELENVAPQDWPQEAVEYALEDAVGAREICEAQHTGKDAQFLKDAAAQQRAGFALHLLMCWGVMTDPVQIEKLRVLATEKYEELTGSLVNEGLVRGGVGIRANLRWTRDTTAAKKRMVEVCKAEGIPIKLTKTGYKKAEELLDAVPKEKRHLYTHQDLLTPEEFLRYTSVDADACTATCDETLIAYSLRSQLHTVVKTHVPDLLLGEVTPIQPRYTVMVDSGRTACSKSRSDEGKKMLSPTNGFQFQNPKRSFQWIPPGQKTSVPLFPPGVGIRECFTARPGKLFADNDYGGLELHTGAQVCLATVKHSELAKALNAGTDPHLDFAASMMNTTYEAAKADKHTAKVKYFRQLAKVANFGLPGGLGLRGLLGFARGYGVKLTEAEGKKLIHDWFGKYPEWREYFAWVRDRIILTDAGEQYGDFEQLYVGRVRGKCRYTNACNTLFQGLGADVAKLALYEVAKRCYSIVAPDEVLYGARPVGFIHDEILAEVSEEQAHEQAFQMSEVMVREGNKLLPDVPVRCVPALSKRWCKEAEAVFDRGGRLQPYDLARDGRWEVFYDQNASDKVKWAA